MLHLQYSILCNGQEDATHCQNLLKSLLKLQHMYALFCNAVE